jgi:flagellar M-ring protein FliF
MALAIPGELERLRSQLAERLRAINEQFTLGQKAVVGVAVLALVVGSVVFVHFASQPSYGVLFSNLQPNDASAIVAKLQAAHVPYQLENNGTTILVPANQVDQERLALAQAGLPQANAGLSIVDKEGITTSAFTQQVDYQQGLQGELENTIDAIKGVQSSQVNLVLPQTGPFALGNQQTPAASVLVTMQPDQTLTQGEVQAIVHLVASAVPNLDPANVTVADSNGNLLAGPGVNGTPASEQQMTQAYDNDLALEITQQLDRVLGPGNADVNVNAQLDFDKVHTVTHGFVNGPNGQPEVVPQSTSNSNTTFTGTAVPTGGVLGTPLAAAPTGGNNNYNQTQQTTQNQAATFTQTVDQAPGAVKALSVSVLTNTLPRGVTPNDIYNLAAATAGIANVPGATLNVVSVPFSNAAAQAAARAARAAAAARRRAEIENLAKALAVALAILVVLALVYRSYRRSREGELVPVPAGLPTLPLESLEAPTEEPRTEELHLVPSGFTIPEGVSHELEASSIGEFIDQQPEEVARLLRTWMQETRPSEQRPTGRDASAEAEAEPEAVAG